MRSGRVDGVGWSRRVAGLAAVVGLAGCPKAPPPSPLLSVSPPENVFLRSSFDTDPSAYLGRFLPEDDLDLDESRGMALACSSLVSWEFIDGGGVQTREVFAASSGVAARLGLPPLGEVSGGRHQRRVAWVEYTLTGKMVSHVEDPAALAACCKDQPDQCTDRMVGEFLQGTGAVFFETAEHRGLGARAEAPGVDQEASVMREQGVHAQRTLVFPQPVYFAFKATPTPYRHQAVRTCRVAAPADQKTAGVLVLSSSSGPSSTERAARRRARAGLLEQVEQATGLAAEAKAKGTVLGVQEVDWCAEAVEVAGVVQHEAHVVGVVTAEEQARVQALPWPELETPVAVPAPAPALEPCAEWVDSQPASPDGHFVVGRTLLPALTASGARMRARAQLRSRAGWVTGLGGVALAKGAALDVQEQDWCVRRHQTGAWARYEAAVLGFVSHAEQDRIRSLPPLETRLAPPAP